MVRLPMMLLRAVETWHAASVNKMPMRNLDGAVTDDVVTGVVETGHAASVNKMPMRNLDGSDTDEVVAGVVETWHAASLQENPQNPNTRNIQNLNISLTQSNRNTLCPNKNSRTNTEFPLHGHGGTIIMVDFISLPFVPQAWNIILGK